MGKRPSKLKVPDQWTFRTPAIAAAFDSHVREQLPWYELATGVVAHLVRCYLPINGVVVDVGAATGNIGRAINPMLDAREAFLWEFDTSAEMRTASRIGQTQRRRAYLIDDAVTFDYADKNPDIIVCFLTLMFVPVARRQDLLQRMHEALRPGGALIVFDKMQPKPGYVGTVAYRMALAAKAEAGASPADIVAKELSLSGVQRPLHEHELSGFDEVFRFGDFAGFVRER